MTPKIGVIGNPKAGRGKTAWNEISARLGGAELLMTERPGHATELARRATHLDLAVAAGGDGTVNEVVNGLLTAEGTAPALGVLPLGSGCDYAKTFDIPHDVAAACELIMSAREPIAVDAGEIRCRRGDEAVVRHFANIAEVGIGPEVVARATRLPRALGPAMYFASFCLTLPRYERRSARITMDAERYDGPLTNLVVAIGRVFGGGMRVAPGADPSDGRFDVQIQFGSKVDYVRGIAKVYRGTHLPHPRIREATAAVIEAECTPPGLIEADGEVVGTTPATFRVLPGALRLKV
ncbi:MAG TPA: diacylglycerol kinase family protein [Actinomycetota bacterium]|nr:diacylglycerol kinase family protein [Actinomycetota bacterium]